MEIEKKFVLFKKEFYLRFGSLIIKEHKSWDFYILPSIHISYCYGYNFGVSWLIWNFVVKSL